MFGVFKSDKRIEDLEKKMEILDQRVSDQVSDISWLRERVWDQVSDIGWLRSRADFIEKQIAEIEEISQKGKK